MNFKQDENLLKKRCANAAGASAAAVCGTAAIVALSARETERAHPATGRFLDVSGVRVHYLEKGSGLPLVLVHGNAMSSEDFVANDIVERLAERYRVIVFDRPGFGYTQRPHGTDWTPMRQAALIHEALAKLDAGRPIVVGHSLGSLVTAALAIAHPDDARALVLLSGYYYHTMPFGLSPLAVAALPVVGDVLRFTVSPILARVMSKMISDKMFAPAPVPESFTRYPLSMSRRPSQVRATTEDANFMDSAAKELEGRYGELTLPIEIVAGDGDKIVNTRTQSERLARELPNAQFDIIEGAGHMIHYSAPERILAAIDAVDMRSRAASGTSARVGIDRSLDAVSAA